MLQEIKNPGVLPTSRDFVSYILRASISGGTVRVIIPHFTGAILRCIIACKMKIKLSPSKY